MPINTPPDGFTELSSAYLTELQNEAGHIFIQMVTAVKMADAAGAGGIAFDKRDVKRMMLFVAHAGFVCAKSIGKTPELLSVIEQQKQDMFKDIKSKL